MADQEMYIGRTLDGGANVTLDMDHLTTHAVCFGMTGSGKTGLGIVALEELARSGIPLLVIDLKGDMVNLLLNFPELAPGDFAPWIPATRSDRMAGRRRRPPRPGCGPTVSPGSAWAVRTSERWSAASSGSS